MRFTQGADDRMFWATSPSTDKLLLREWPDTDEQPGPVLTAGVEPYTLPDDASIAGSEGPNGKPWLDRVDSRLTAGWVTDKTLGFAWTSGKIEQKDQPEGGKYAHPHVRVAIFDRPAVEAADASGGADLLKPVAEPHIWNSDFAFAYPSAAPNKNGDIGLSMFFGGPKNYPSAAVGVLRNQGDEWQATLAVLAEGKYTPRCVKRDGVDDDCGKWGDYMSVRADADNPGGWYVATHSETDQGGKEDPRISVTFGAFSAD